MKSFSGIALAALAALALGCASAYQRTYDKTYDQLESQADAERQQEEAEHAEAKKYAAVVYFATDSSLIDVEGQREISWFVEKMQPYPKAVIDVQGFTDSTGSEATNAALSLQRTQAVVNALVSGGIAPERIRQAHYGGNYQAATNTTPEGRRNNRRVEISVQ